MCTLSPLLLQPGLTLQQRVKQGVQYMLVRACIGQDVH